MALRLFKPKEQIWNEDLADFVEKEFKRRQEERRSWELQWRLNLEFLNGNQYVGINPSTSAIQEIPKLYWWQEREVFNQIATIIETRMARLSRTKPILKTRPASADDADISAAKISSMLLNSSWHDQDMDRIYDEYVAWLETCGTVLLKPIWDFESGRVIFRQEVLDLLGEQDDEQKGTKEKLRDVQIFGSGKKVFELREGDIKTVLVPPFEFFPDSPWRSDIDQCRSVIHAKAYHVDEIEELWGQKVDEEKVDVVTMQLSGVLGGLGYTGGTLKAAVKTLKNHAIVKEYYERPSKRYPDGRFIVVAGNKTLHAGPLPYLIGDDGRRDLPFIRTVSIPNPGCFWGKSVIERLIPVQRRYNALRNRKAEYLNLVAIGQWRVPYGSVDDDTQFTHEPGAIYYFNREVGPPEPIQFPNLPASFENEISTLLDEFTAISGVSELSRMSEAPPGVKSGVALSIANEQDDTRISNTASRIVTSIERLGKYWLRLYKQFAVGPRVLRATSANMDVEVMEWTASQLKSDDVVVENSSALGETAAQRRQMVFDLLSTGIFNRPETNPFTEEGKQKVLELLEFGHWETESEGQTTMQKRRARRENYLLMQGTFPNVNDFDDHALHIEEHNKMRMRAEYDNLLRTPFGQVIDQMVRTHIMMHQEAMKQQLMAQAQSMMQQAASPPSDNRQQNNNQQQNE